MGFSSAGFIGHTGGDPGVMTMMFFDPKTNTGRLLIINTGTSGKAGYDNFYHIFECLGIFQSELEMKTDQRVQ
jgi:hypothetical protein